jgi:glycosyltransferase involved in cell wall biosynthesis
MAQALPVVATRIPGCLQALGEDYPYLFEEGNCQQLAEMIVSLATDVELRISIGNRNKSRVASLFSLEKMGLAYLNLMTS